MGSVFGTALAHMFAGRDLYDTAHADHLMTAYIAGSIWVSRLFSVRCAQSLATGMIYLALTSALWHHASVGFIPSTSYRYDTAAVLCAIPHRPSN